MTARGIKAVALDFDGVLTDGHVWWGPEGQEWKRLGFRDIMGVSLGTKSGLAFAIISGENSPLVDRYADQMKIRHVFKGTK
jgi:3-deoxy-D-manno-octulosonate 8-phosphate phosphatase (KDO 8-P phosphatase)